MAGRVRLLAILGGLAGMALWLPLVDPDGAARILMIRLAGALLLIFGLGSLGVATLFNGTRTDSADRGLLVPAFGIAILTLGGIVLNLVPSGLTVAGWIAWIASVVAGLLVLFLRMEADRRSPMKWAPSRGRRGVLRQAHPVERLATAATRVRSATAGLRQAHPVERLATAATRVRSATAARSPRTTDVVLIGAALAVSMFALGLAHFAAEIQPRSDSTALWLLPVRNDPSAVEIGVISSEHETTTYTVRLNSGPNVIGEWTDVTLAPGASWRISVSLDAARSGQPIEAILARADAPTVTYRMVVLYGPSPRITRDQRLR
jgi:hypothetical protein